MMVTSVNTRKEGLNVGILLAGLEITETNMLKTGYLYLNSNNCNTENSTTILYSCVLQKTCGLLTVAVFYGSICAGIYYFYALQLSELFSYMYTLLLCFVQQ